MREVEGEEEDEEEGEEEGEEEEEQTPLHSPMAAAGQEPQGGRGVHWGPEGEEEEEDDDEEEEEGGEEGGGWSALALARRRREGRGSQRADSFATYVEGHRSYSSSSINGYRAGGGGGGGRGGGVRGAGGLPSALVRSGGGGREGGRVVAASASLPSSSSLTAAAAFRLPLAVRRAVWEENMTFFQDKHRFDPHYARFLWQLLRAPSSLPSSSSSSTAAVARLRAYAAGLRFAFEVLLHARASSCVPPWFNTLRSLLLQPDQDDDGREGGREEGVRRCGLWTVMYLADDPQGRKAGLQALLSCPHLASRGEVVALVLAAAREVVNGGGGRGLLEVREGRREGERELAHPLARLVGWYLVVVTYCAGVDGGVLSPPPEEEEEEEGGREGGPSPSPTQHGYYHPPTPSSITSYGGGGREGGMGGGSTVLFDITPEVLLLLLEVAALGPALRRLLRGLGGIARLAALVASFNGGDNRYLLLNHPLLAEGVISLALRLLAALAEEASPDELHSPSHLSALSSRRFVEMAATFRPEHTSLLLAKFVSTSSTSSSLPPSHLLDQQHVTAATAAVIRVLVDRAVEAAALASQPPPSLPPSTSSYAPSPSSVVFWEHQRRLISLGAKPLLRVLQAVLGVVEEGGREGGEQQAWRLEQSLPLLDRCTRVLMRGQGGGRVGGRAGGVGSLSAGEMDLVWSVARLYFSLAARSSVAAVFVSSRVEGVVREWRKMIGTMGGGGGKR